MSSKKCQERHDDLCLVVLLFQHLPEAEFPVLSGISHNRGDLVLQTHRIF